MNVKFILKIVSFKDSRLGNLSCSDFKILASVLTKGSPFDPVYVTPLEFLGCQIDTESGTIIYVLWIMKYIMKSQLSILFFPFELSLQKSNFWSYKILSPGNPNFSKKVEVYGLKDPMACCSLQYRHCLWCENF